MGHSHAKHAAHPEKKHGTEEKVRRSAKSEASRPHVGKSVEKVYDIDPKVLGRGHYGVVRKCVHKTTKEACAVKSITKKRISRPEVLKREISILKKVKHPNIIEIKDVFEDDSHVFIVTELCTGGELFERIIEKTNSSEGHYSEHDAAAIVCQVLEAVKYCHGHQIAHRDLKPENFLFATPAKTAALKIIDFGLARVEDYTDDSPEARLAAAASGVPPPQRGVPVNMHTRVGTPYYIAPEVLARNYGKACDLWSIGVITYILLCGYPPFNGSSDVAIFERVKRGLTARSFPAEDWDDISQDAKDFITNLLNLDASKRMTAAEALEHDWIVKHADPDMSRAAVSSGDDAKPKRKLNGDQLANRLQNFVHMSKLKQVALNVLAHHLTEKEISDLKQIWRQIDTDNTGFITISQLRDALRANGHHTTEQEVKELIAGIDTDHNNVIDYWEFAASLLARNQNIRDDRIKEIFDHIDKQHHGYITVEDLTGIMGSTDHALEVIGDDFPDGKITLEAFRAKIKEM